MKFIQTNRNTFRLIRKSIDPQVFFIYRYSIRNSRNYSACCILMQLLGRLNFFDNIQAQFGYYRALSGSSRMN